MSSEKTKTPLLSGKDKKKEKEKKKQEKKEKRSDRNDYNLDNDTGEIMDNIKRHKFTYLIVFLLFFTAIYFQYKYEASRRYDAKKDSDVDYYEVLGVDSNADLQTIKKKYRELSKQW